MNWKPTWVLLAAAAATLAFIVCVERPLRRQRERQASRVVLPGLEPSLVTNIEIHPWGRSIIQAVRENGSTNAWRLTRPVSYAAQNQRVAALLDILARLQWEDRVGENELKDRPNAQADFGFTNPLFTLLVQGSGPDRRLEVGSLSAYSDQVSLQVVGNTAIFEIPSEILRVLSPDKNQWRDPSLLSLTNIAFQTLRVRADGNEFDLERNATNHLWFMRKPHFLARADTPKINDLLDRLQKVLVGAFVTDDPQADLDSYGAPGTDGTPDMSLSFLQGTNTVAGLQVGRSVTNYPDYAYARRDVTGNIVAVAKEALKAWQAPYTNFLDPHFISLSPSLVESIAVQGDDHFVARKQTNGQWEIEAGRRFPADATLMDDWLASLTNTPAEIAKAVVTDFSPYGLDHPFLRYTVRFGPEAGAQAAQIEFGTNQAGQVFERRPDEDFVNTVGGEDFERLPRASWELRDRQVWNFASSNVVSVTVRQLGGANKFLRDPDGNWTYAPGFNSQVAINSPALEECVYRMGRLRAIYWDGAGGDTLDRFGFAKASHEVEFEVKHGATNETFRIQFGARSPLTHPYASVEKDGQRLVFEFPVDLYEGLVEPNLTLFTARFKPH